MVTIGLAVAMVACQAATPKKTQVTAVGVIADMKFVVGDAARTVNVAGNFDAASPDYVATSGTPSVAGVSITAAGALTVTPKAAGTANVVVTATATADDEDGQARQNFTVTVTAPVVEPDPDNNAPRLRAGKELPHHPNLMFGGVESVDLSEHFTDDDDDVITYGAESTDEGVVTVSVSDSTLTITVVNHGVATIRVTATDSYNQSTREAFDVEVINQPPMKTGENTHFGPYSIGHRQNFDLSDFFTDPENDSLTYTAESNDDTKVTVTDPGTGSMITIEAVAAGTAMITVIANDGESDSDPNVLTVTVSAVPNVAPMVVGDGIPDQSLQLVVMDMMESVTSEPIDLSMYFMDPDELPMPLTYSDESDMTMIDGSMLTITASVAGKTMITVTASDGEASIPDDFYVMVTAPDAPTRTDESLGVQALAHDAEAMDIELGGYFEGATGYDAESDDTTVVMVSVSNSTLTLTPQGAGTALVTVTADNSGGEATVTFRVKVSDPAAVALPTNPTPIPSQKVVLGTPKTLDISSHFTGATSYRASGVAATVTAEVTDAGMLTLTPVAHGTAEVRVTAINSAGEVSDDFTVTVQAPPAFKSGKEDSLPHIRIAAATLPGSHTLADLMSLFEDPDGDNASLTFKTETSDVKKVFVLKRTLDTGGSDTTTVPTDAAEIDKAVMAAGPIVNLYGRAAGSAEITVTVTDGDKLETVKKFMVTVIAAVNGVPTQGDDGSNATSFTGATRLKMSGGSKKAIDDKPINDYFFDPDFNTVPGDMLEFTVEYTNYADVSAAEAAVTSSMVTIPDANKIAPDDRVATVELSTYMWDGDPLGSEDKFTATVTPRKPGPAQMIVIIATDKAGAQHVHAFAVQVNHAPVAQGAQEKDPKVLSSFTGATGLRADSDTVMVDIVEGGGGYFSDKDLTTAAGGDTLTCSFRPSVTGETAPAAITWNDTNTKTATTTADDATGKVTLDVNPKDIYDSKFVPMTVTVWCMDETGEKTAEQSFSVTVTAAASIQ